MQPLMAASSCLCLVRMAQGPGPLKNCTVGTGEQKCGDQTGIWECAQPWASGKGRDEASELEESNPYWQEAPPGGRVQVLRSSQEESGRSVPGIGF